MPPEDPFKLIEGLRSEIDEIDREIINLISRRVEVSKRIGELKKRLGLPAVDLGREAEVLRSRRELAARLSLDVELVDLAFKAIVGMCRRVQRRRVAFLGPRGSFSEEAAARAFLKEGGELQPMPSIGDVFRAVELGDADYGVVPVENSLEGGVGETLDQLVETPLRICGEVKVKASLCLIARPGTSLQEVELVLSHPHALNQCRAFLSKALRHARVEVRSSTAEAVREAVLLERAAALGSRAAAILYGGEVLASDVQDSKESFTRFLVLGRERLQGTVGSKTSIIFKLPHTSGSLYNALQPFASRGINLTRIESRPARGELWSYVFHVDFEGDCERDEPCREALEDLKGRTLFLKVLGSYGEVA